MLDLLKLSAAVFLLASQALADANYNTGMFFHSRPAPSITSVTPTFAKNSTSITLTVNGVGILPGVKIMVGSTQCTSVTVTNFTKATCTLAVPAGTGTNTVTITNANSTTASLANAFSVYGTKVTFSYSGANQTWTVPAGVTEVGVRLWGPGGGGSGGSGLKNTGGAGGYVSARLAVTPGDVLTIIVGGRGVFNNSPYTAGGSLYGNVAGGFGGGGRGYCVGDNSFCGGSGGGRTAVRNNAGVEVLVAGGGGAGACSTLARKGGPGGELTGYDGGPTQGDGTGGVGGTQTQGGAGGANGGAVLGSPGSQYAAGDGHTGGGAGGGSGWYGGGGGTLFASDLTGGGGGSSYYNGAGVTWAYTKGGSNQTSGGSTEPDYSAGIGAGGAIGGNGGHGYAVIIY